AVGATLAALCIATAPVLVEFYREDRLFWITIALAAGFLFNAAGVPHSALLEPQLRYFTLSSISLLAQTAGLGLADRHGVNRVPVLGLCGFGVRADRRQHGLPLDRDEMDSRTARAANRRQTHVAFRRNAHVEPAPRLPGLQLRQGPARAPVGCRRPRPLRPR